MEEEKAGTQESEGTKKQSPISVLATIGGIGYLPLAPGTWASLVAAFAWYEFSVHFPSFQLWQWFLLAAVILAGIISSEAAIKKWGKDPSRVVIDEVAGMWIACMLIPPKISLLISAFILFRFFDILKPWGIRKAEKLKGGLGI